MANIKTLVVTDADIKQAFKVECAKNGTDMSTVTEALWLKYIGMSIDKRRQRAEAKVEQLQKRETHEG